MVLGLRDVFAQGVIIALALYEKRRMPEKEHCPIPRVKISFRNCRGKEG